MLIFISDPSFPLVNFFFFSIFWQKTEQADSTFFSEERDVASTGSPRHPSGPAKHAPVLGIVGDFQRVPSR